MQTKTKIGFSVIQVVEIPVKFLRKGVLKALDGREMYTDAEIEESDEKIYAGDVFEAISCEDAEIPTGNPLKLSAEDLKQVKELAKELGNYELIRINTI